MADIKSSFSQHNLFAMCPKTWYWSYILKIPQVSDMCYANGGTCIHKTLQKYYTDNKKNMEECKEVFGDNWQKFHLDDTKLKLKRDEYWLMCVNGFKLNKTFTSTEFKIFFPEVVCYIDALNTNEHEIVDWKSSTRSEENEHEYKMQMNLYAWLYYRKFNVIPNKCTIYYLKNNGTKGELSFSFTMEDIQYIEKWYYDILEKMKYYIENPDKLPLFNRDFFFAPYKAFWDNEENGKLSYTLHIYGNYIQIEGLITELLKKGIEKKFSYELKDAFFIKKRNRYANTTVKFWDNTKQVLPIGFKDGLIKTLCDYAEFKKKEIEIKNVEHREFDQTIVIMPEKFINGRTMREYQQEAVDIFLRKKIGILELATGSGKTECAIEIIRQVQCKTLFVVDKVELLNQTQKRIKDCLGIEVGIIGAGNIDIKNVTVATVQTLHKNITQLEDYLKTVKFVIFDETHHAAASSYVKISKYLTGTLYRLGLSATAFRTDGNDMQIYAVTGNIVHSVPSKYLIERGFLVKPSVIFIKNYITKEELDPLIDNIKRIINEEERKLNTGLINETPKLPDSVKYRYYYDEFICNSVQRNGKIYELVNKNKDKKILILTKSINHGKLLQVNIPGSYHLYGESKKLDRKKMFDEFVAGGYNVLISTISIFSEGIDIPALDMIINAAGNKGDVKTIQIIGRVLRILEGKKDAHYYDFFDNVNYLVKASMSRMKALQKEGHDVEIIR
jgi:superfamily II DNA or RNA helicase/CRISPR/Cas system-associated exonuclease Cas4 (RecB family)